MTKTKTAGSSDRMRVDFNKPTDPDRVSAIYGHLSPAHLLGTFDYTLQPGMLTAVSLACIRDQLSDVNSQPPGLWLVNGREREDSDEYGWLCIHWPSYMYRVVARHDTYAYLTSKGCSLKGLQKMRLPEFEDAQEVIDSYKAVLLRTLPPGCLLEADNPFYSELFELFAPPSEFEDGESSTYSANLRHWSIFRFGGLVRSYDGDELDPSNKRANTFSNWLKPYSVLSHELISKALKNAPMGTPTLIMTLLTALSCARYSNGQGWQKWGIAWTCKGLVFNYRQAVNTIREQPFNLYASLFKGCTEDPCADWLDPAYMMMQPPARELPRLADIALNDSRAIAYAHKATSPYYVLFQDPDPSIAARKHLHGLDYQILFPIRPRTAATTSILRYINVLATYDEVLDRQHAQAEAAILNTALSAYPSSIAPKPRSSTVKSTDKKPPTTTRDRAVYVAGFDGYNLGCSLPPTTQLSNYPFNVATVEYLGDNYFTVPDNLAKALPELLDPQFYDRAVTKASLIWNKTAFDGCKYKVATYKKQGAAATYGSKYYADITLSHFAMKRKQFSHTAEGVTYLHHAVFRPEGEFNAVADAILAHHPALNPDHADLLATFRTLWQWVYDIRSVIAQGKVTGELMYTVGLETTHCPPDKRLDTPTKRLQYIIDKAKHSREERVCDLTPSTNRSAPRSKDMNTYDDFVMWYAAHHEIAELPWRLHPLQQAEYICKRWLHWRRPPGLVKHLIPPYKEGVPYIDSAQMPQLLDYAQKTFGVAFTEY